MNFKPNTAFLKKHMWSIIAVLAVVFIGVWLVLSKGGGGGGAQPASGPSDASIAAAAQEQGNQDQLTAQNNQNAFQLAYLQTEQNFKAGEDVQSYNLSTTTLADQLTIAQAQLAAQLQTTKYTTDSQLSALNSQLNAQVTINNQNNQTAIAQQGLLAQEQEFSIAAQSQLQSLISNNQTLVATTQIGASTQIAQINATEQEYIAKQNASVQKQNGLFGGILGILGAFF